MYRHLYRPLFTVLSLLVFLGCQSRQPLTSADAKLIAAADQRPNIMIVMVDDMGFSDPGCYGGEIQTPNLDRLAGAGVRFTQFYNTSRCCPTRAALLTGLYPHQAGVGQMTTDRGEAYPGYRGRLTPNAVTIAEVLRENGYRTGMVGKWHLSLTDGPAGENRLAWLNHQAFFEEDFSDRNTYPTARGFEKYYGNIWGVVNYFDPFSLVNGEEPAPDVPDDFYYTDAISDTATAYIEEFSKGEDPFFLYVAHCAPHWPLHARPEDIAKYRDTYQDGWDAVRRRRYERQVEMGLFEAGNSQLPEPTERKITWAEEPRREWEAQAMAVHAAMIDRVDQGLGRIIAKLEETGELDNTIILFLSDNGASPERPQQPGFDRNSETREGKAVHYSDFTMAPGPENTYTGIGRYWANVANTPFRYWKARTFEGGIATPLIAHWPAGIRVAPGSINRSPGHVVDLMATCLDVAGADYPQTYEGRAITPLEGKSLLPVLQQGRREGHETIFFEHFTAKAIRQGDWKAVCLPRQDKWELYNLAEDRTETNNLAEKMPEKMAELKALWQKEAERLQVFPQPER